jgi:glycosyltransferase involved in cell wall biosynthesis
MSWGLPVVSHAIDGIPELVVNNESGILVEPGDKEGFKNAIVELIKEPSKINGIPNNGQARVAKLFSLNKCASIHAEVLSKISSS